jgi:hypothetical protein
MSTSASSLSFFKNDEAKDFPPFPFVMKRLKAVNVLQKMQSLHGEQRRHTGVEDEQSSNKGS